MHPVRWRKIAGLLVVSLVLASAGFAQEDSELRDEIEALKQSQQALQLQILLIQEIEALKNGQESIRNELAAIRKLLESSPGTAAPPRAAAAAPANPDISRVVLDLGGRPSRGEATAPLTLVEFTDYQCPYCARHVTGTNAMLEQEYIDSGKLRLIKLDLPLGIHKDAFRAALASHCARDQGKFWEMHDRMFANQTALEPLSGHAEAVGLDLATFESCMSSEKYADVVRSAMTQAAKVGATGTPSFVLGRTDPENSDRVQGITFIRGAQPFAAFKAEIDKALAED